MSSASESRDSVRFAFRFDPAAKALLPLGIRPESCEVTLTADTFVARFGPFVVETPVANVADVATSGSFRTLKALGPRLSLADRGATFGTSAVGGVCVRFHEPVAGLLGSWRPHTALTVTVDDPDGLATELRRRSLG